MVQLQTRHVRTAGRFGIWMAMSTLLLLIYTVLQGDSKILIISFSTFKKEADITTITIFRMVSVGIFFLITECRI